MYKLAQQHGVAAIVFEMVKTIPKEFAPPKGIVMRWLSYSLSIEKKMMTTEQIATKLADKLTEYNIPVVILKGPAYATYYTNPYHRESGDLDCFLMGKKEEGDKVVMEIGGTMEEVGYKHSILYYK